MGRIYLFLDLLMPLNAIENIHALWRILWGIWGLTSSESERISIRGNCNTRRHDLVKRIHEAHISTLPAPVGRNGLISISRTLRIFLALRSETIPLSGSRETISARFSLGISSLIKSVAILAYWTSIPDIFSTGSALASSGSSGAVYASVSSLVASFGTPGMEASSSPPGWAFASFPLGDSSSFSASFSMSSISNRSSSFKRIRARRF